MYLNVVQLAESFGVEESVVEGWIRNDGLPCIHDRGRLLFDRAQVVTWAAERGLAAKAGFLAATQASASAGRLEKLVRAGGIWRDVPATEVVPLFERALGNVPGVAAPVRQILVQRLRAPGGITWAPVGDGFALPHLRSHVALGRDSGLIAIVLLRDALKLDDPPADGLPVTRLIFFMAPSPRAHLELLGQLSAALTRSSLGALLKHAAPDTDIFASLAAADTATARPHSTEGPG